MKEILDKLLNNDLLTESTRNELQTAITESIAKAKEEARREAVTEAQVKLTKQWDKERTALVESIDSKVEMTVKPHIDALQIALNETEDLKVRLSAKALKHERALAKRVASEYKNLAEDIDQFLKKVVAEHMQAAKDDIAAIKEDNFGRKIYRAFVREYIENHHDEKKLHNSVAATKAQLSQALEENARLKSQLNEAARKDKMKTLLAPLTGETRKIMEAVLANVPTNRLDESYKTTLSRVLRSTEKETQKTVLAETANDKNNRRKRPQTKDAITEGLEVSGDDAPRLPRYVPRSQRNSNDDNIDAVISDMQRLAGIQQ